MKSKSIAYQEATALLIPYIILSCITLAVTVLYWVFSDNTDLKMIIRHIISLILGSVISFLYFYLLAQTVTKSVIKPPKKAKKYVASMYVFRYVALFAVLVLLIKQFNLNVFLLWIPLLFPRVYYIFKAAINK